MSKEYVSISIAPQRTWFSSLIGMIPKPASPFKCLSQWSEVGPAVFIVLAVPCCFNPVVCRFTLNVV